MKAIGVNTQADVEDNLQNDLEKMSRVQLMSPERENSYETKTTLTVEEISDLSQWRAIKDSWIELLRTLKINDPFLTYEWFDCCLRSFQGKKKLFVLLVREGSTILGIAPLWYFEDTIRHIPLTRMGFIICPDTAHVDFIVSNRRREIVLNTLLHHVLVTRSHIWDVLTLSQWPSNSINYLTLQRSLFRQKIKNKTENASLTPYILLEGDWKNFLDSRSARFRKTRRNIVNKLAKHGQVDIQCARIDTDGKKLQEVIRITERSWKYQEGVAIACSDPMREFFEALTKISGDKGWLLLWVLRLDEVPIAMEYDLVAEGKVYALRADFDEAYSELSPGTYLETEILQQLFQDTQYEIYHTGPGMNQYKLHWTDQVRENITLHVFNENLKGKMVFFLENRAVPILRYLRALVLDKDRK